MVSPSLLAGVHVCGQTVWWGFATPAYEGLVQVIGLSEKAPGRLCISQLIGHLYDLDGVFSSTLKADSPPSGFPYWASRKRASYWKGTKWQYANPFTHSLTCR